LRRPPTRPAFAAIVQDRDCSFKLPERLEIMTSFPISPAGKILKRELRELVAQRLALEQSH
jgi:2,3-dihydroxybenzoate-AMP ligase